MQKCDLKIMDVENKAFAFSGNFFPKSIKIQKEIQIPLSLSLDPFNKNSNVVNHEELMKCEKCNSYLFSRSNSANTPSFLSCQFCKTQTNIIQYNQTPEYVEWQVQTNSNNDIPRTLFLIDASLISKSCGFFNTVITSLPNAIPNGLRNFAVAAFNSVLCVLTPKRLLVFSDIDYDLNSSNKSNDKFFDIPPNAFYDTVPNNLGQLLDIPTNISAKIELIKILNIGLDIVGKHGRVILLLSSPPVGFHYSPSFLELRKTESVNFNPYWKALQEKYIEFYSHIDFLINQPSSSAIDTQALYSFSSPMHSRFCVTYLNQVNEITEILRDILESYVVFVRILFPSSLKVKGSISTNHSYNKFYSKIRNCNFLMNSKWCKIVDFDIEALNEDEIPFQVIISYRNLFGIPYIRVFNGMVQSTESEWKIIENLNQRVFLKKIVDRLIYEYKTKKDIDAKYLLNIIIQIISPVLSKYRILSHNNQNFKIFVSPDSISNIPIYCLGALKSSAFIYGTLSSERVALIEQMEHASLDSLIQMCFPQLLNVTEYLVNDGEEHPCLLKRNSLNSSNIYILYDLFSTWIWVGSNISQALLISLFNCSEFYQIEELKPLNTDISIKLYSLIKRGVKLCLESGIGHQSFLNKMVEDPSMDIPGYIRFLMDIQNNILTLQRGGGYP